MNKLKELAAEGNINPRYITTKKILENYHDIVAARKNMHTWAEIAEALGMDPSKNSLLIAWRRINREIKAGRITIPDAPESTE
jgi:ribosomal protein L18E